MRSWILGPCIVLAAVAPAAADDTVKAKQLYDEGLRHFNVAEYPQAIESWKQAYLISKKPLLLFNIGQAYRLSGDCAQAMTFYDNYQNAEPSIKNQDELDHAIAACKAVEAKPVETKPVEPEKPVTPAITTQAPPTETPPVNTSQIEPAAPALPPPPPTTETSTTHRRTIGLVVGIGGIVLEGGAILFALEGHSNASDAQNVQTWDQHAMDLQSAGQLDNKLAWGCGLVGAAAIATGVVLYVTGGASAEHGVAIVPTRGGAQLGWAHSF